MKNWTHTFLLIAVISTVGLAQSLGEFSGVGQNRFASPGVIRSAGQSGSLRKSEYTETGPTDTGDSDGPVFTSLSKESFSASWQSPPQNPSQPTVSTSQTGTTNTNSSGYVRPPAGARFRKYVKNVIGPFALVRHVAVAGIAQANDTPEEWEQGASGYGKRLASQVGRSAIQETVNYGLQEAMKLDGGFRKSEKSDFKGRLMDALLSNITARTPSGRRVLSVPRFASVYTGSIVQATTWYPDRYSVKDGLRTGTVSLGVAFGINVVREFLLKR